MRAFIRFNEHEDRRCVIIRDIAMRASRRSRGECEPVRIRKAAGVPMPRAKRRQVVSFSSHGSVVRSAGILPAVCRSSKSNEPEKMPGGSPALQKRPFLCRVGVVR